jgi:CheY-like chemotaxis protein
MGGDITVTSIVDSGSTFRFAIPVERGGATVQQESVPSRIIGITSGHVPAILVVDDLFENRDWLMRMLTRLGFSVRGAESGEAALQTWREWQPQLVLMDMHMPGMDGLEATRRIKSESRDKETAVIMLTASAMADDRSQSLACGADAFLAKPCSRPELLETIRRLLSLTYEYDAPGPGANVEATPVIAPTLGLLQAEMAADLLSAVRSGNKTRLDRLIVRVRLGGDECLAEVLQTFADKYDYDGLTRLLDENSCPVRR